MRTRDLKSLASVLLRNTNVVERIPNLTVTTVLRANEGRAVRFTYEMQRVAPNVWPGMGIAGPAALRDPANYPNLFLRRIFSLSAAV